MTREQAIMTLIVVDENATCDDCLYYNQMEDCPNDEDCIIRQALDMAIKALEQEKNIKALGEDMRIMQKAIKNKKVLIGFNLAVAICNKHLGKGEEV